MSTAVLEIRLMGLLSSRRPDLRTHARVSLVNQLIRLCESGNNVVVDRDGDLLLTSEAEAMIGTPAAPEQQPAPSPPDTSALQDELAKEENPIRRAQIRERIGRANGITSTRENP